MATPARPWLALVLASLACASGGSGGLRIARSSPWDVASIALLDADGAVRERIEAGTRHEAGPEPEAVTVHIAASADVAVVTRQHLVGRYEAGSFTTAFTSSVTLYGADGTPLFETRGGEYICFQVSTGGHTSACMVEHFELEEVFASPYRTPREEEPIVILGHDGSEKQRISNRNGTVNGRDLRLSPNGRWLAYPAREAWSDPKVVLLRDLRSGDVIRVPGVTGAGAVSDDGDLMDARPGAPSGVSWEVVWRRPR